MKTAHISFMPSLISGVQKKILQSALASLDVCFDCDFYILNNKIDKKEKNLIYKRFEIFKIPLSLRTQQKLFTHLLIAKNVDFDAYDFIILRYPGSCSIGSSYFFEKYGKKIITEHQTNEDVEYMLYRKGVLNWIKFGLEPFFAKKNLKKVKALIGVTKEIVDIELKKSGKKRVLSLPNGIDIKSTPFTPASLFEGKVLKLLFISSGESSWHGLDRLIECVKEYRGEVEIELHVVGGFEESKYSGVNIVYHGFLDGEELDRLFLSINIGISSLGLDRLGLRSGCVLKSREYMARGVPFVYGYEDEDFDGKGLALYVDRLELEKIIDYAQKITPSHQKSMRDFAASELDWCVKIEKLLGFLKTLKRRDSFEDSVLDFAFEVFRDENVGTKILELGCGDGKHLQKILDAKYDIYGVDVMRSKIERANSKRAILIEGKSLPFESGDFDAVFSYQVFEHIKDVETTTSELFRVLKLGGVAYLEFAATYPLKDSHTNLPPLHLLKNRKLIYLVFRVFEKFGWFENKREYKKSYLYLKNHLHYKSYAKMDAIFRSVGFDVIDLSFERRKRRFEIDGVGTLRELFEYRIFRKCGKSKSIGFFVYLYLFWHAFIYKMTKNRSLLLRKNSE